MCLVSAIPMATEVVAGLETTAVRSDNSTGRAISGGTRKRSCSASPRLRTVQRATEMAAVHTRRPTTRPWRRPPWSSAVWRPRPRHRGPRRQRTSRRRPSFPRPSRRPPRPPPSTACPVVTRRRCRRPALRCPPCRHRCPPATWRILRRCPGGTPPRKWVKDRFAARPLARHSPR